MRKMYNVPKKQNVEIKSTKEATLERLNEKMSYLNKINRINK